jgi:hypothetical protein
LTSRVGFVGPVAFLNGDIEDAANDVERPVEVGRAVMLAVTGGPFPAILLREAGNVGVVEVVPGLAERNQRFQLVELGPGFVAMVVFDFLALQLNDDFAFDGASFAGGETAMVFEKVGQPELGDFQDVRFQGASY